MPYHTPFGAEFPTKKTRTIPGTSLYIKRDIQETMRAFLPSLSAALGGLPFGGLLCGSLPLGNFPLRRCLLFGHLLSYLLFRSCLLFGHLPLGSSLLLYWHCSKKDNWFINWVATAPILFFH